MPMSYLSGNVTGSDMVAFACLSFILLLICPVIAHAYQLWRRFLMSSYQLTDLTLNDIAWDDFRCVVYLRVRYCREPWYPHGNDSGIEGGGLEIAEITVVAATLLDCLSSTCQANPLQCAAIQRQLRLEADSRRKVAQALEGVA